MDHVDIVNNLLGGPTFDRIRRLSLFPTTLLIEGEVGSGKKMIAETIHSISNRANMRFVKIHCGSIPENLFENDTYGIDSLAVPSVNRLPSIIETADMGTLFLEEAGELSPKAQVKLLNFLQERDNGRIVGRWTKSLNIRVIASTSFPLSLLVKEKKFREDLFYRLNVANVKVPPLRSRPEKILPLIEHFLQSFCQVYQIKKSFKKETLHLLKNYSYPGNILELKNLVELLCVNTLSEEVVPDDLPEYIHSRQIHADSLEDQIAQLERSIITQALQAEGSIRKAAARLQTSHATLLRKMQKLMIEK